MKERLSFFIEPEKLEKLRELSTITRVTQADYIREGIEHILEKYKAEFQKAKVVKGKK